MPCTAPALHKVDVDVDVLWIAPQARVIAPCMYNLLHKFSLCHFHPGCFCHRGPSVIEVAIQKRPRLLTVFRLKVYEAKVYEAKVYETEGIQGLKVYKTKGIQRLKVYKD